MTAFKRLLLLAVIVGGFGLAAAPPADAGIFFRGGPVRRAGARAVLPSYPVARRPAVGRVYRPYYRPYYGYRPVYGYRSVYGYGPGLSVGIGVY